MHLETIAWSAIAPGTTGAAAVAVPGDSLVIRHARAGSKIYAMQIGAFTTVAAQQQIKSSQMHDAVRGYQVWTGPGATRPMLAAPPFIGFNPQEQLSVQMTGGTTAGVAELGYMSLWYEDSPGLSARLSTWDEIKDRVETLTTVAVTIAGVVGPAWGGDEPLDQESDLLKANRDYAVLGAGVSASAGLIAIRGPDTANTRVGIPVAAGLTEFSTRSLVDMSVRTGLATIPVVNAANKSGTFITKLAGDTSVSLLTWLNLALLR